MAGGDRLIQEKRQKSNAVKALLGPGWIFSAISLLILIVAAFLKNDLFFNLTAGMCLLALALFIPGLLLGHYSIYGQCTKTSEIMEPLLGKDPYLDLRAAAFLTVGAMPEWLREQMSLERRPEWRRARLAEEPYTVERAGFDYLNLMLRIEQLDKTPSMFYGKSFPPASYRLPDSLKDAVGEIVLFLSSLPESGEKPREDVVKTVMDTIDSLAIIDGKSFTATLRRAKAEAVREKDDAYNGAILDAADAARDRLSAKNDEGYKIIARGMDRMDKLSRASVPAIEAADSRREWAPSASCSI